MTNSDHDFTVEVYELEGAGRSWVKLVCSCGTWSYHFQDDKRLAPALDAMHEHLESAK